jgi:hypothetical protein
MAQNFKPALNVTNPLDKRYFAGSKRLRRQ